MAYGKLNKNFLPINTDFDHLQSEYEALKSDIPAGPDKEELDKICVLRVNKKAELRWQDVYAFQLLLLKYLELPSLRNKVISLRDRYINIFGQDKYRIYLETKLSDPKAEVPAPPDGTTEPVAWQRQKTKELIEQLREDCKYLLDQIYRAYDALTAREGVGKWLTIWAVAIVLLAAMVGALLLLPGPGLLWKLYVLRRSPIVIVFFAGALGGMISILQRLQAVSTDGDPIYSLTAFWNGSYTRYVSPLTGAVFGVLLYLIFAGTILQGKFFPTIFTPSYGMDVAAPCNTPVAPTLTPTATSTSPTPPPPTNATAPPGTTPTPAALNGAAGAVTLTNGMTVLLRTTRAAVATPASTTADDNNSNAKSGSSSAISRTTPATTQAPATNETATPTPTPTPTPSGSTAFGRFLRCAGPASGLDYALLIIWCFIAGFAERLVPDTLNRLVAENDKTTVKKS